jgi:hypothetical protein
LTEFGQYYGSLNEFVIATALFLLVFPPIARKTILLRLAPPGAIIAIPPK